MKVFNLCHVGNRRHLEHQEVELGGVAAVVVVDGRRRISNQNSDRVVPPHQLFHDVPHVQPMAVLAWKNQNMAAKSWIGSVEEEEQEDRGKKRRENLHHESKDKNNPTKTSVLCFLSQRPKENKHKSDVKTGETLQTEL